MSGTLRHNLDPFGQYEDATLNDALRSAGLFSLQEFTSGDAEGHQNSRLTLDSDVSAGGGNMSVGQRQIIALARAIVRSSKLLILDEGMYAPAPVENFENVLGISRCFSTPNSNLCHW